MSCRSVPWKWSLNYEQELWHHESRVWAISLRQCAMKVEIGPWARHCESGVFSFVTVYCQLFVLHMSNINKKQNKTFWGKWWSDIQKKKLLLLMLPGWTFSPSHSLVWLWLELQLLCLFHNYTLSLSPLPFFIPSFSPSDYTPALSQVRRQAILEGSRWITTKKAHIRTHMMNGFLTVA